MEQNVLTANNDTKDYKILEKEDTHALAESNGQKYLIENLGFDKEEEQYLFDVIDNETVCLEGDHGYKTPTRVELSGEKVESSNYDEIIDSVLEDSGALKLEPTGLEGLSDFY